MIILSKNKYILILLCICFSSYSFSQVEEQKKDSTEAVYKKIEDYSAQRKSSKFLHRLIFKTKKKPGNKISHQPKQNYKAFEDKIIRHIKVDSHDPFGFSFSDSTKTPKNWLEKAGNKLHTRSKAFAIKNYIIFKENSPLDSLKIIESERLIRSQKFIRAVEITVKHTEHSSDSVDVYISTLDSWSIVPNAAISSSKMKLQLREQNYLGFGHQFKAGVANRFSDGKYVGDFLYTIPNFKSTYINSVFGYTENLDGSYSKRFNIDRSFFSSYTRWAAGIYLDEQFKQELLPNSNMELERQNFKYLSQDVWAGYSIPLFKGQSQRERAANIITAMRLLHIGYKESPSIEYDDIKYFTNETFYLGSLGISSRQYLEDRYIFRDGITENVPIGDVYAISIGNQYKNNLNRLYLGAKIAHGNYYNWGYFSANFEYGTFFNGSKTEQTAYSLSANYFSNLIDLGGDWKMRQFVKPELIIGKNRLNSVGDRLTIDENNNFQGFYGYEEDQINNAVIPGFDSNLMGTSKYVLSLQTQFYPPWKLIGFRFNPYLNFKAAMLGDDNNRIVNGKMYSSFSVGVILRNDYLVFKSLQLSLTYYPDIPGQGYNVFNTNSLNIDDFGLHGFELGKPSPIWYN